MSTGERAGAVYSVLLHIVGFVVLLSMAYLHAEKEPKKEHVFEMVSLAQPAPQQEQRSQEPSPAPVKSSPKMPDIAMPEFIEPAPAPTPKPQKQAAKPKPKPKAQPKPKPKPKAQPKPEQPKQVAYDPDKHTKSQKTSKPRTKPKATAPKMPNFDPSKVGAAINKSFSNVKIESANTANISQDVLQAYLSMLYELISKAYVKPQGLHNTLEAELLITVGPTGGLKAKISRSSGNAVFDKAALEAVDRLRRVQPPPGGDTLRCSLPFRHGYQY